MLYDTYEGMIINYKDALRAIEPNTGPKSEMLKAQIIRLEGQFVALKAEIGNKYGGGSDFSREWIFQKSFIERKTLIFELRPGSVSYKEYGHILVGWARYDDEESKELLSNIVQKEPKNTNGQVKIELVMADLSQEKLEGLKTVGIKTSDIQVIKGRL
jgi:hypothetical protein